MNHFSGKVFSEMVIYLCWLNTSIHLQELTTLKSLMTRQRKTQHASNTRYCRYPNARKAVMVPWRVWQIPTVIRLAGSPRPTPRCRRQAEIKANELKRIT